MNLLDDLDARGLIHDSTDRAALEARLAEGPISVYVGFDPTADSLHAGNLLGQVMLRRFQLAGHRPVVLAGGATGMVGDPGGRSEERNLLDAATLAHNVSCIKRQLERILEFDGVPNPARLVDNATWTAPIGVLDFLRDVGKYFTVNQMVAKESVRARMESENGISFTEFSYMLLQSNDFRHMFEVDGVEMQMGGSDQWGNITGGIELVRRRHGGQAYGLTWPLLTRSDGQKMGKSVNGALWLDPAKVSPYQFRQYWIQLPDADVERFLLQLTLRPVAEIRELVAAHQEAPERRLAQRALAADVTTIVHGSAAEKAAAEAAEVLFGGDPTSATAEALAVVAAEAPYVEIPEQIDGLRVHELLVQAKVAKSNGEVSRLLGQKAVRAGNRVLDEDGVLQQSDLLSGGFLLLRKGKREFVVGKFLPRG